MYSESYNIFTSIGCVRQSSYVRNPIKRRGINRGLHDKNLHISFFLYFLSDPDNTVVHVFSNPQQVAELGSCQSSFYEPELLPSY